MTSDQKTPVVLHAEQEHTGIRVAVFAFLFLAYIVSFQVVVQLIERFAPPGLVDYTVFLSCVGAIVPALLIVWLLERVLKRYWHSGLAISMDEEALTVIDKRRGQAEVQAERFEGGPPSFYFDKPILTTNWAFQLSGYPRGGRERRISSKWWCLATEIQQDGLRLNVYTFLPPEQAEEWMARETGADTFQVINQSLVHEKSIRSRVGPPTRPSLDSSLLHSKDGRFWLAERRRWESGIELTPADFMAFHLAIAASPDAGQAEAAGAATH